MHAIIQEIEHRVILFLFLSWWKLETPLGREDAGGMKFASREKSRALSQGGGTRFVWKSCLLTEEIYFKREFLFYVIEKRHYFLNLFYS